MAANAYKKVQPGERLQIPAQAWNALMAQLGGDVGNVTKTERGRGPTPTVVRIKNNTGAARARFHVVKLGEPVVKPADDADLFKEPPVIKGDTPGADTDNIAILQEPLETGAAGDIGKGIVAGVSWVQIDVVDSADTSASPIASDTTKLQSGTDKRFPIIWKETGTGTKWGVVLLGSGGSGGSGRIIRITSATKDGDGYQDGVIADYQSGAGDEIKVYNYLTAQDALPSGADEFYHAELLTEAPAGSPTVPVYGLVARTC